jgi:hypothetical protein
MLVNRTVFNFLSLFFNEQSLQLTESRKTAKTTGVVLITYLEGRSDEKDKLSFIRS